MPKPSSSTAIWSRVPTSSEVRLAVLGLLLGCGGGPTLGAPPAHSSFEDPANHGAADGERQVLSGGSVQAHDLLIELVSGLLDEDDVRVSRLLEERMVSAAATNHGDAPGPRSSLERSAWVRQMIAAVHAARLPAGTPVSEVIEAGSITVDVAASYYPEDGLPREVVATDLVVRFRVAPPGRRALSGLAPSGSGLVVIRPGPEARVIAR